MLGNRTTFPSSLLRDFSDRRLDKVAFLLWCIFIFLIAAITLWTHHAHSVVHSYYEGAWNWLQKKPLYNGQGNDFIYFPHAALIYIPFAILPTGVGECLWRMVSVGLFGLGIWEFSKNRGSFFYFTLICLPLTFASARNGQMNVILAAMMCFATRALSVEKWGWGACWLCLGLACKPTMLVLWLLVFALYSEMRAKLLIGLLVLFCLPFLTQPFVYVWAQYQEAWIMLHDAANLGIDTLRWAQAFSVLGQMGWSVPTFHQILLRGIFALVFLYFAWVAKKKNTDRNVQAFFIFSFAAVYLMLFNPRTENNDYLILVPTLAFYFSQAMEVKAWRQAGIWLVGTVLIGGSYMLGSLFTPGHVSWLSPFVAFLLGIFLVWKVGMRSLSKESPYIL